MSKSRRPGVKRIMSEVLKEKMDPLMFEQGFKRLQTSNKYRRNTEYGKQIVCISIQLYDLQTWISPLVLLQSELLSNYLRSIYEQRSVPITSQIESYLQYPAFGNYTFVEKASYTLLKQYPDSNNQIWECTEDEFPLVIDQIMPLLKEVVLPHVNSHMDIASIALSTEYPFNGVAYEGPSTVFAIAASLYLKRYGDVERICKNVLKKAKLFKDYYAFMLDYVQTIKASEDK